METVVLVTGGFDPVHSGHISYFKQAKTLGPKLFVGLNSDAWLARKKGKPFMPLEERAAIIQELKCVDRVISFDDSDNTACSAISGLLASGYKVIFANGGDRKSKNTPEANRFLGDSRVSFVWGVGGEDKKNSSSWILDSWTTNKTERSWGYWRVLDDKTTIKVKELVIKPKQSLSNQKHYYRNEHWYILSGVLQMKTEFNGREEQVVLTDNMSYVVNKEVWHKATNIGDIDCHILEIQYGTKCEENDIERKD